MVADILSNVLDESNAPAFEATAQVSGSHFAFLLIGISDLLLIKSAAHVISSNSFCVPFHGEFIVLTQCTT